MNAKKRLLSLLKFSPITFVILLNLAIPALAADDAKNLAEEVKTKIEAEKQDEANKKFLGFFTPGAGVMVNFDIGGKNVLKKLV